MHSKRGICFCILKKQTDSRSITNGHAVMLDQTKHELKLDSMEFV